MEDREPLSRAGSLLSLPMALLLVIFFFLPWVNLTCGGHKAGSATGWQLVTGDMTPEKILQQEGQSNQSPSEAIKARPWFILCLIIPVVLLGVGVSSAKEGVSSAGAGKALLVLGILGVILTISAANVDYSDDIRAKMEADQVAQGPPTMPPGAPAGMETAMAAMQEQMFEQISSAMETEGTGILWASLVLYVLVALCGVANLVLPQVLPAAEEAQPGYQQDPLGLPRGAAVHPQAPRIAQPPPAFGQPLEMEEPSKSEPVESSA